jgi:hypothetical protein
MKNRLPLSVGRVVPTSGYGCGSRLGSRGGCAPATLTAEMCGTLVAARSKSECVSTCVCYMFLLVVYYM